jgi:methylenetetrahydrofolate reductase (NADPH)
MRWCGVTRKRPASAASWRCAATRPEGVGQPFTPHPGGYQERGGPRGGDPAHRRVRHLGRGLPGEAPAEPRTGKTEIDNLKRKLDAGADARHHPDVLFDTRRLSAFRRAGAGGGDHRADRAGDPADPFSFKQISNFAARCGASIPGWVAERFEGLDEEPETHALVASAVAAEQVLELVDDGM